MLAQEPAVIIAEEEADKEMFKKTVTTYQRKSVESMKQINMLTNDFKDFPEHLAAEIEQILLARPHSYYGYVLVPDTISDADVFRTLNYDDPLDKYFIQLTIQMKLDFTWYDECGRHVMVWSSAKEITYRAIWAIERWLGH